MWIQKLYFSSIVLCIVVAIFLRFYKLGNLPSGLTWDEAAIGYNAYGLLTNHRDEWLHRTPVVFQSFGDYKSPLLVYMTMIPVLLFGLTDFSVRIWNAVLGSALVVLCWHLFSHFVQNELGKTPKEHRLSSLIVTLCVALSPWGIQYSRMGFESMIAAFFTLLGVTLYFHWKWSKSTEKIHFFYLLGMLISFVLAIYAYHSAKVVVPLTFLALFLFEPKIFLSRIRQIVLAGCIAFFIAIPFFYASLFGKANARAFSTTIFSSKQPVLHFAQNVQKHADLSFLLFGADQTYRHSTKQMGVFYPIELGLLLMGILIVVKKKYRKMGLFFVLFCIGFVPASLGIDAPHGNRAFLAFPWGQMFLGIVPLWIGEKFQHKLWYKSIFYLAVFGVLLFSSLRYRQVYETVYTSSLALQDFGYGYGELLTYVREQEKSVDRVYFTNRYGQAYIYILFAKKLTPMEYFHGGLANYTIINDPYKVSSGQKNVLIVGTQDEIPTSANIVKTVYYPDGSIVFKVVRN